MGLHLDDRVTLSYFGERMKPVPPGFVSFILANQRMLLGELYTFTFRGGGEAYFTDLDFTMAYGGKTFFGNALRIEGLKFKIAVGWQVDEQEIKISAFPTETLAGATFFGAVEEGLLDGAYITRQRAFWQVTDGRAWIDYLATPVAVITLFTGRVSTIDKIGRTHVEMKLKSPLSLLDIDMPRNTYQPSCQWTLYDTGCTLSRPTFTSNFTVVSATALTITVASVSPTTGGDGAPYYQQGRLLFTSGTNNNFQTLISSNDGTHFFLQYPLDNLPSPGDTFAASAGCLKTGRGGACELKFNNLANFRGFPRVPPMMISF